MALVSDTCGPSGACKVTYKCCGVWAALKEHDEVMVISDGNAGGDVVYSRKGPYQGETPVDNPWENVDAYVTATPEVIMSSACMYRYVLAGGVTPRGYTIDANAQDGWLNELGVALVRQCDMDYVWSRINLTPGTQPTGGSLPVQHYFMLYSHQTRPNVDAVPSITESINALRSTSSSHRSIVCPTMSEKSMIKCDTKLASLQRAYAINTIEWNLGERRQWAVSRYDELSRQYGSTAGTVINGTGSAVFTSYAVGLTSWNGPGTVTVVPVPIRYTGEEAALDIVMEYPETSDVRNTVQIIVQSSYVVQSFDADSGTSNIAFRAVQDELITFDYGAAFKRRVKLRWPTDSAHMGYYGTWISIEDGGQGLCTVRANYVTTNSECTGSARAVCRTTSGKNTALMWNKQLTLRTHNEGGYAASSWKKAKVGSIGEAIESYSSE